jgi:NAD(P)-dependent dehydrogenase (short-subunit alcohol dehydrogenase family)
MSSTVPQLTFSTAPLAEVSKGEGQCHRDGQRREADVELGAGPQIPDVLSSHLAHAAMVRMSCVISPSMSPTGCGHRAGSYADSKLFVMPLAAAVAPLWPNVLSNAVDPGWVPTRMGGPNAPDDLDLGHHPGVARHQ